MKTGSQSNVFDYDTGDVNQTQGIQPTTRMYPPKTIVVPGLPWVDEGKCTCTGPYHKAICPYKTLKSWINNDEQEIG